MKKAIEFARDFYQEHPILVKGVVLFIIGVCICVVGFVPLVAAIGFGALGVIKGGSSFDCLSRNLTYRFHRQLGSSCSSLLLRRADPCEMHICNLAVDWRYCYVSSSTSRDGCDFSDRLDELVPCSQLIIRTLESFRT